MPQTHPRPTAEVQPSESPGADVPFGVNALRLSARQWLATLFIVAMLAQCTPWLWRKIERFDTGRDYRIPYALSKDYWLYERRLRELADTKSVVLLGDSVVWGEYVLPDGTLSHFLNEEAGQQAAFINAGVNGLFPLALEGLTACYGRAVHHRRVILHCNVLWMTSPKADLSTEKEEPFNHARLVPQFSPRLPCYKADASARLTAIVDRNVEFLGWIQHLQTAYFDEKSILDWTLADDGGDPPRFPHAWQNPLARIGRTVPSAPTNDPQRGPLSPRHKPWSQNGTNRTHFDWVTLDHSLQWQAFQRLVQKLRSRGNDVMVVLGPFNLDIISEENRPVYHQIRQGIDRWLTDQQVPHIAPEPLPSALYADASHPLTEGYQLLAKQLYADAAFRRWLAVQ